MKSALRYSFCLFLILLLSRQEVYATHNRAGEITYRQLSKFTYEITLITYTDSRSTSADRPTITLTWGDNNSDDVQRDTQTQIGNFTFRNVYIQNHTYSGPGTYIIQFEDPNRIQNIINMANSVDVPFYVESELQINPTVGSDHSPKLLRPPLDFAEVGVVFTHNPNAYDADGDSLNFSLIPPKQAPGKDVPGYVVPKSSHSFTLDPHSGQLVWDAPELTGIYNIAILIEEYRRGIKIGYIVRDMQIIVSAGNNHPPKIDSVLDTCVVAGAGAFLHIPVTATDIDKGQNITLSATGGPFLQSIKPATFETVTGSSPVSSFLDWQIDCSHVRKQPYQVVFRAVDDDPTVPLADIKFMNIKVIGPAPKDLKATVLGSAITLTWQPPDSCNVKGYFIYRRADSASWQHSYCETGVPSALGFRLVDTILNNTTLNWIDSNGNDGLAPGVNYCYLITAIYLNSGQFDFAEGYASNQVCARLNKDVPVITNVSVVTTSDFFGGIRVAWSKPSRLDTIKQPGPYRYNISRMNPDGKYVTAGNITSNYFGTLVDTMFEDTPLATRENQYTYKINFQNTINGELRNEGKTVSASSIFLSVRRGDHRLFLTWNVQKPWTNNYYVIYRKTDTSKSWDSLNVSTQLRYTDSNLQLGRTYCYKIKSVGTYGSPGFVNPIINFSEYNCSAPKDTVPPCAVADSAVADCDARTNSLEWTVLNLDCNADVTAYKIYFSRSRKNNYSTIDSISSSFLHYKDARETLRTSLAGCYYVTAVDSFGNESPASNICCVDNCPIYKLPNVFTPNGDGKNDIYGPLGDYRFIDSVDMRIFNRWGMEVFKTTDPAIKWDGRDMKTGNPLAAGTYFFICIVKEFYLDGVKKTPPINGTITLIR